MCTAIAVSRERDSRDSARIARKTHTARELIAVAKRHAHEDKIHNQGRQPTSASKVASMAGPAINGSPSGTTPSSSAE